MTLTQAEMAEIAHRSRTSALARLAEAEAEFVEDWDLDGRYPLSLHAAA